MVKQLSNFFLLFLFSGIISQNLNSQTQNITLEEIWGGAFRTQSLESLHPLNNGTQYSVFNFDRASRTSSVEVYDYKTGNKVKTLIDSKNIEAIPYFISYEFNKDESLVLLATDLQSVYRRSTLGTYYVYDIAKQTATLLTQNLVQEPTFSPDGKYVAYGFENNLYIKNLETGNTLQITNDGKKNEIINGITDWVYEEEFAFVRAFDWNKNSNKIAYIKFNETNVPEFSMDIFGETLYPAQQVFKYPKAGEKNAEVSLHIFDLETKTTQEVNLSAYNNYYIPRIKFTEDANVLSVQLTNRKQNILDLVFVEVNSLKTTLIHQEKDEAYVDVTDNLTFLNDNSFIWTSENNGWNHIYHYDKTGKLLQQVTNGNWEVTSYYGFDAKTARIFYQSTENGSTQRDIYSITNKGKNKVRLSQGNGTHNASFSADFSLFINTFSNTTTPYVYTLHNGLNGKLVREIKNNDALKQNLSKYKLSPKEFSTISVNGEDLNMYTIKPLNFDASKKYPVFMYQYSGPGSQNVSNTWHGSNDYWHQMLAQEGIIVVCIDGRGTGYKGRDFKKITQLQLGKYEVEDQIEAAKKIAQLPYVDASKIGIWGWSYGGFMASNCLFQGADVFAMAIAVAPVTSWRFYDTIYTERYMTTPQENASGYDDNSPITHVEKLQGDFLLVHGSADDNVHYQNTMRLAEALIQANKDFDWLVYPDDNHGIYGGYTRLHLYRKMTNFVKQSLLK